MNEREELMALRRMAELEAKAVGSRPMASRQMRPEVNPGRAAMEQGIQGATFGFGDEISDALGAFGAKVYSTAFAPELTDGKSVSDLYTEARGMSKERLKAQLEQYPEISIPAQIAGSISTGAPKALLSSLRTGRLSARAIKGGATGAASGGLYGAGTADDGNRLEGAETGAVLGGSLGAGLPLAGAAASGLSKGAKDVVSGLKARDATTLSDLASGMKSSAGSTREKMKQIGAVIGQQKSQELTKNIDEALKDLDLIPELSPKTTAIVNRIRESADSGSIELNKLDQYRRLLRSARDEDTVAASSVRKAIDATVNSLSGAEDFTKGGKEAVTLLNQFRKEYTQASKFDDVADIIIRAKGDPNKIKTGLTNFLNNNDGRPPGFTTAEIMALRRAANSTKSEQLLKGLGRFGFEPNNVFLPLVGGSVAGFGAGAPIGVGLTAGGTVARQLHKLLGRGKAEEVLRIIESGGADDAVKNLPKTSKINATSAAIASTKAPIYSDIDKKISSMRPEFRTQRLKSLNKKMQAGIITPKEMYERELLNQ